MNHHVASLKTYFVVYVLLLAGLAATVGAAYVPLGPLNVVVMLVIAFAKAALVALYFMHVRESPPLNWIAIASGLVWLVILFGLTLSDFETRDWIPVRDPVQVE
jgi:cytochrome c oxidase subunit 4